MKYTNSKHYGIGRPEYPPVVFEGLARLAPHLDLAWDAATGTGQSAIGLAAHFGRVIASDISPDQIQHAERHPQIEYRVSPAEKIDLADDSVSLITVAAGLHWFDVEAFCLEARRVLCPGGILAVWTYADQSPLSPEVDRVLNQLSRSVASYALSTKEGSVAAYQALEFPFEEVETELFDELELARVWTFEEFLSVLRSWSAVQAYDRAHNSDIVSDYATTFEEAWGNPHATKDVYWCVVGRVLRNAPA